MPNHAMWVTPFSSTGCMPLCPSARAECMNMIETPLQHAFMYWKLGRQMPATLWTVSGPNFDAGKGDANCDRFVPWMQDFMPRFCRINAFMAQTRDSNTFRSLMSMIGIPTTTVFWENRTCMVIRASDEIKQTFRRLSWTIPALYLADPRCGWVHEKLGQSVQQETDRIKNEKGQGCCLEDMVKNLHVDAFVNLCRANSSWCTYFHVCASKWGCHWRARLTAWPDLTCSLDTCHANSVPSYFCPASRGKTVPITFAFKSKPSILPVSPTPPGYYEFQHTNAQRSRCRQQKAGQAIWHVCP